MKDISATKISWDDFAYHCIDSYWFQGERPKTLEAVRRFYEKVPAEVLDKLTELKLLLFAPDPNIRGNVVKVTLLKNTVLIYLSPELEKNSQQRVDVTVAHEFAHVFLGNYDPKHPDFAAPTKWSTGRSLIESYRNLPDEKHVHELLQEWGFEKRKAKKGKL